MRIAVKIAGSIVLLLSIALTATARASIWVYNTKEDIDVLCKAIENCRKVFGSK